jgi:hypothetical protein
MGSKIDHLKPVGVHDMKDKDMVNTEVNDRSQVVL